MNSHVPQSIQDKWPEFHFTGKPFEYKARKYFRAQDHSRKKYAIPLDGSDMAIAMEDLKRSRNMG